MFQQMLVSNPQMKPLMNLINMSNGNYQAAFNELAKQKNLNPNVFASQLKQVIGL